MGLDPGSMWLIGSMLGSSALGALGGSEGQELNSFDDNDVNPINAMKGFRELWGDQFNRVLHQAYVDPYKVQTTANPLPSFVGGGLPMAISVPGQDPERLKKRVPVSRGGTMPDPGTAPPAGGGNTFSGSPVPTTGQPDIDQVFHAFSLLGAGGSK